MAAHPATGAPDDCQIALRDRFQCYALQDCTQLDSCNLWGCQGADPCADEAEAVEAACVRTPCEQYWDATVACGDLSDPTLPAYCEYRKQLDRLVAADDAACHAAFDERIGCFATLDCDGIDACGFSSTSCADADGVPYCASEQTQYGEDC